MNIAVIGWGSLIWKPGTLNIVGDWESDGPLLPIEFARVSADKRLTLVIKPGYNVVQTLWALSGFKHFNTAIENLMDREETSSLENIGFVNLCNNTLSNRRLTELEIQHVSNWCEGKNLDAVIWTDLGPNFFNKTKQNFTKQNLVNYLTQLSIDAPQNYETAKEYILNTPPQIKTRYRDALEGAIGLIQTGTPSQPH